ncbi:MAG: hypothetical protein KAT28_03800 [Candidatus Aenigmarchaeota archaeon]|nr:hypothetical protein [Candidatus Aenigmarchaeota archaeon]
MALEKLNGEGLIEIEEIELAEEIKDFISESSDVNFENEELKKLIMDTKDDELLKITKVIGSPIKITEVKIVDDDFLEGQFKNGQNKI